MPADHVLQVSSTRCHQKTGPLDPFSARVQLQRASTEHRAKQRPDPRERMGKTLARSLSVQSTRQPSFPTRPARCCTDGGLSLNLHFSLSLDPRIQAAFKTCPGPLYRPVTPLLQALGTSSITAAN